ncbi:MAG TPA: hypothetical protein VFF09_01045 [archaeon]|nr:hypothetical protein [archaeon]
MVSETVVVDREEFERLKTEVRALRNSGIYRRLLEFEENIAAGKKFYRKDLGF